MNSTKHLKNNFANISQTIPHPPKKKNWRGKALSSQHYNKTNTRREHYQIMTFLMSLIKTEQNSSRYISTDHSPQSHGIHLWDANMAQHIPNELWYIPLVKGINQKVHSMDVERFIWQNSTLSMTKETLIKLAIKEHDNLTVCMWLSPMTVVFCGEILKAFPLNQE